MDVAPPASRWYNGAGGPREREMDDLKSALDDLTAKVERLVAQQAQARKSNP